MSEAGEDSQKRMVELLEEIAKWTKVTSIPRVKDLLQEVLSSDNEKIAYHVSDGLDSRSVGRLAGVGASTIARWWKVWLRAGIAKAIPVKGGERAKRIFSLEDFGIGVPIKEEGQTIETKPETEGEKGDDT